MFTISWIDIVIAAGIPTIAAGLRATRRSQGSVTAWKCGFSSTFWCAAVVSIALLVLMLSLDIARSSPDLQHTEKYVIVPIITGIFIMVTGTIPAVVASSLMKRIRLQSADNGTLPTNVVETGNPYQPPHT